MTIGENTFTNYRLNNKKIYQFNAFFIITSDDL